MKRAAGAVGREACQYGVARSLQAPAMTIHGRISALRAITIGIIVVGLVLAVAVLVYVIAFGPTR